MILSEIHIMSDLQELWSFKSFRLRIFMAIAPTLLAMIVGYFAMDRTRPYEFIVEESSIVPPSGKGGDQITVVWAVKETRRAACPGIVERKLVDPQTNAIIAAYEPSLAALNGEPDGKFLRKTFLLPRGLQRGWIGYQADLTYTCNWLQVLFPGAFAIRYKTPKLLFNVEE